MPGEIGPLSRMVRARYRDHHHGRAGASGIFQVGRRDRRCQGGNLRRPGLPAASRFSIATMRSSIVSSIARAMRASRASSSFGEQADTRCAADRCVLQPEYSTVQADILGDDVTYKLGAPGRHLVMNSLAVLAAAKLAGADLAIVGAGARRSAAGAGARHPHCRWTCPAAPALLIDESYNANPVSMRAAHRASRPGRARPARAADRGARRHARTGRAIGLLHRELAQADRGSRGRSGVLLRPGHAKSVGGASLRTAGAAMPVTPARSNRRCSRRYRAATPSWSRARTARK